LSLFFALILAAASRQASAQVSSSQPSQQPTHSKLSSNEISKLKAEAEQGGASAQLALGQAYEKGNGVPQNDELAVKWFRRAADQNNAVAENELGLMYVLGRGVQKDKEEAVRWYHEAAKQGNPQAMFNLGASYYNGDGVPENLTTSYAWFLLAQDAGYPEANEAVNRSAEEGGKEGTSNALLRVATMYEKGEDLPQSYQNAARWYRRGADTNPEAAMRLAIFLINGVGGLNQDYGEALKLCSNLAKGRSGWGEYCVGYLHEHGLGVPPDLAEAARWYGDAALDGSGKAALTLADMHLNGEGVPIDRPQAYWLLFLAYRNGVPEAKSQAHALRPEMNAEETNRLDKKLREHHFDPKRVYAIVDDPAPSDPAHTRQVLPLVIRPN